jgi:hypothetical protein
MSSFHHISHSAALALAESSGLLKGNDFFAVARLFFKIWSHLARIPARFFSPLESAYLYSIIDVACLWSVARSRQSLKIMNVNRLRPKSSPRRYAIGQRCRGIFYPETPVFAFFGQQFSDFAHC